jgi:hypothetical protein
MLTSPKNPIKKFEHELFLAGIILCVVGLPFSNLLMSLSQFFLLGVWLLSGDHKKKLLTFVQNKHAMLITDLFLVYLFGLFYAENVTDGWHEVRIKIPLLIFPLVLSWYKLRENELKAFLGLFIAATLLSTGYSFLVYLNLTSKTYTDIREISVFISHIRLSLNIVMAIVLLIWTPYFNRPWHWALRGFSILWFVFYLIMSESVTGIVIMCVLGVYFVLQISFDRTKSHVLRYMSGITLVIASGFLLYLVITEGRQFQNLEQKNTVEYAEKTKHGGLYKHDFSSTQVENGHYIWRFVCWEEMKVFWAQNSQRPFMGKDERGNPQFASLLRYATSRGLTKDLGGLQRLTKTDIEWIEKGYTNYRFTQKTGLRKRIYEMFWEIDSYLKGVPPMRGSVSQRFEFWKVAIKTIQKKFWAGYGTGDVVKMMSQEYQHSQLHDQPTYWMKPHHQFLTFFIQFGFLQTLFILFSLLFLVFSLRKNSIYVSFFLIYFLSMMTEDTIDTQAGITFYAFFQSLLILGWSKT